MPNYSQMFIFLCFLCFYVLVFIAITLNYIQKFRLVLAYNLLQDRCIDDFASNFFFVFLFFYYVI